MASSSNFALRLPVGSNELQEGVIGKRVVVNALLAQGGRRELFNKIVKPDGSGLSEEFEESLDTQSEPGYWILNTNAFVTNGRETLEQLTYNVHQDGRESLADVSQYVHKPQVPQPGATEWIPIYREP